MKKAYFLIISSSFRLVCLGLYSFVVQIDTYVFKFSMCLIPLFFNKNCSFEMFTIKQGCYNNNVDMLLLVSSLITVSIALYII